MKGKKMNLWEQTFDALNQHEQETFTIEDLELIVAKIKKKNKNAEIRRLQKQLKETQDKLKILGAL